MRCVVALSFVAFACDPVADGPTPRPEVSHHSPAESPEHEPTPPPSEGTPPTLETSHEAADAAAAADPALLLRDADIPWDDNPVMQRLGRVAATMTESEYSSGLSVNEQRGIYKFDCSGMVYWVLRKAAPKAASALAYKLAQRPLARDIYRRIAATPPERPRNGWQRLSRVGDLRPGDVVAWIRPKIIRSPNTGHVGFVVLPPLPVHGYSNAHLIRFADSTSLLHDRDTRVNRNGFGLGTILLVSDPESGAPIAYGWVGLKWRAFETDIALGRPVD